MRARIFTAMVLGTVLFAVLLYGPVWAPRALFGLFVAAGAWEWSGFLGVSERAVRIAYVLLVAALAVAGRELLSDGQDFLRLMQFSACWWTLALLWLLIAPRQTRGWSTAVAGPLALIPAWVALTHMVEMWPRGSQWVLFILTLAFAADTGAYFAGHAYGRVKLAPQISPGKTWEGVVGGMVFAAVVGYAGSRWFDLAPAGFIPLCLAGAGFSVVGDLTESMFKRAAGLKDSGRLFPGHGGVLDRVDGVLAATPVMCLGLLWLGVGA
jgi:phosphatidate cytidylyltransferase